MWLLLKDEGALAAVPYCSLFILHDTLQTMQTECYELKTLALFLQLIQNNRQERIRRKYEGK